MHAVGTYEHAKAYSNWHLANVATESLKARFDMRGTEAGLLLGRAPGTLPLNVWLHSLYQYLRRNDSRYPHQETRLAASSSVCLNARQSIVRISEDVNLINPDCPLSIGPRYRSRKHS
jgi:hypothetical protein